MDNQERYCAGLACGAVLTRKVYRGGSRETEKAFAQRKYCSRDCFVGAVTKTEVEETKVCAFCGEEFGRRRMPNGTLEFRSNFAARRFCSNACKWKGRAAGLFNEEHRGRYRDYVSGACEACGAVDELHVHHVDGDHSNNEPVNLQTLCEKCHIYWHSALKRMGSAGARMPRLF